MAGKMKKRKKNLSRGTWIGIGVGVVLGVPALILGGKYIWDKTVASPKRYPGRIPAPI